MGSRAAVSHTGAIVGGDDVFDAALRRTAAMRVDTFGQFIAVAEALSAGVKPRGNRLAVVTNGGGKSAKDDDEGTLPLGTSLSISGAGRSGAGGAQRR